MYSNEETKYLNLVKEIEEIGDCKYDRTGVGTKAVFGRQLKYNLFNRRLPITTTRKIKPLDPLIEMIWFISGDTNIEFLKKYKINIWDSWVLDGTQKYDSDGKLIGGSIGSGAYGAQWRNWEDTRIVSIDAWQNKYKNCGYQYVTALNETHIPGGSKMCVITRRIDQLKAAIEMIKKQPDSRRIIISAWNPARLEDQALPPCFLGDALVSTPTGYKPISEIKEGDEVYTASMKVQKVNQVWKTPYKKGSPLVGLKCTAAPHALISTPNHPHLTLDAGYVVAEDIDVGDSMVIPLQNKETELKPYSFKYKYYIAKSQEYREFDCTLEEKDYYSLGYFVGNGWYMENSGNRICVAIPHAKRDEVLNRFRETVKVTLKSASNTDSVATYETRSLKWSHVFSQCGHLAPNKEIPEWVFTSPVACVKQFFDGFVEADGYIDTSSIKITTTSRKLALGLQRIAGILGYRGTIQYQNRPATTIIEGREVNQHSTYNVRIGKNLSSFESRMVLYKDKLTTKVQTHIPYETEEDTFVYNLDVGEEHTYIVENFATHNCHTLYQFYTYDLSASEKKLMLNFMLEQGEFVLPEEKAHLLRETYVQGKEDEVIFKLALPSKGLKLHLYARSQDYLVGTVYNTLQYAGLAHMVAQVTNTWASQLTWSASDIHVYSNQWDGAHEQLQRMPIECTPTLHLNPAVTDIDDFTPEDFTVEDYEHQAFIKYPIAV